MASDDTDRLSRAYSSNREVFNRHFKSLDEAKAVEARALAGDDKAQMEMWGLYRDGTVHEEDAGFRTINNYYTLIPVDLSATKSFERLARAASNHDALPFSEAVKLGLRKSQTYHDINIHRIPGGDSSQGVHMSDTVFSPKKAAILLSPYSHYHGDMIVEQLSQMPNGEYDRSRKLIGLTFSQNSSPQEVSAFISSKLGKALPDLETCARAGEVKAAKIVATIYGMRDWSYEDRSKIFGSKKSFANPYFDLGKADKWEKIAASLDGQVDEKFLDSFILSQDKTPGGLYNIGYALMKNEHVRKLYNERIGKAANDWGAGNDFLKHAANMGSANAAWYLGDLYQSQSERENKPALLSYAAQWYRVGAELGHPNAKHRYTYLTQQDKSRAVVATQGMPAVNPSSHHIEKYPHAVGHVDVPKADYSFLRDESQGGLLERIERASRLSDTQVENFNKLMKVFETRIQLMLAENELRAQGVAGFEKETEQAFAVNTKLSLKIGEEERKLGAAKRDQNQKRAAQAATALLLLLGSGGVGVVAKIAVGQAAGGLAGGGKEDLYETNIAGLTAQMTDMGLLKEQQKIIREEFERLKEAKGVVTLQKEGLGMRRLVEGYLRQQVLEQARQNAMSVDEKAKDAGINSIDSFLDAFRREGEKSAQQRRVYEAIHNFCLGGADSNDLHIMLAYSDTLGKRMEGDKTTPVNLHEAALHAFVEKDVKVNIDDYVSKASRIDVLKSVNSGLLLGNDMENQKLDPEGTGVLGALARSNFASSGSLEINRIFDFYLHRHGGNFIRATRLDDGLPGDSSERKSVRIMSDDAREEFIDRAEHFSKYSADAQPKVESLFMRICASEYFEPQDVVTSGSKANFKDNPQAPVAYPMINDVVNAFIENMSLSPIGKYREQMEDRKALDALVAQSFIDFFAVLGQTHAQDSKFKDGLENLRRSHGLQTSYKHAFNKLQQTITEDAMNRYGLFKDIFEQNLQKTLDVSTEKDAGKLLKQLEEIKAMGSAGLDPQNIVIPGTEEAFQRALKEENRFSNMRPPKSGIA